LNTPANHLIDRLPDADRQRFLKRCDAVQLVFGEVLCEAGAVTAHVYFPVDSFVSLIAQVDAHAGLEVGMVGGEGMVGTQLVLGVDTAPLRALVQGAGGAWRIAAGSFRLALVQSPALRRELQSYVYVLLAQTAASAVCLHVHEIGPRLARLLLMTQDRAHDSHLHMTHEFLALMLGVRRVGITVAAGDLQRRGLISYHRGQLQVLDRAGLEHAACSCYASDKAMYAQQFGVAA
jgi:CRP-like cAMP-binding protein